MFKVNETNSRRRLALLVLLSLVLVSTAASGARRLELKKKRPGAILPLTAQNMTQKSNVGLSLVMLPFEDMFGLAMMVGGQYSISVVDIGVGLPFAVAVPEEIDSEFVLGNLFLHVRARHCFGSGTSYCIGGDVAASFGVTEIVQDTSRFGGSDDDLDEEALVRLLAWATSQACHTCTSSWI